ncbi:MAG: zinc ribbon domain-containing protein, partial [Gemmatimonadota bacterium]|nr:zinc ribbon domain-containing protein [Gemmatimonadota bacterium]MDE2872323.1 zinc ribbon domain-containing protein [Gemmatimonadota bacterium]
EGPAGGRATDRSLPRPAPAGRPRHGRRLTPRPLDRRDRPRREARPLRAESAGGSVTTVAPHHTSRECSACGRRRDITLAVRVYRCGCGLVLDRDVNAARNVLQRAMCPNPGGDTPERAEHQRRAGAVLPASA